MTSTRNKGRKHELDCYKQLTKEGWMAYICPNPHKWAKTNDIFGMFDVIAVKQSIVSSLDGKEYVKLSYKRYIQVKSGSTQGCKKKLKGFKDRWLAGDDRVEVWIWVKHHGWRIIDV